MMNKRKYLFMLIITILAVPKLCIALSITGYESVSGSGGYVIGEPTCTSSGTVGLGKSKIRKQNSGICVGGGERHGTDDYCCDSDHNSYENCVREAEGCDDRCHGAVGSTQTRCENNGGTWSWGCDVPESKGTKTDFIHDYSVTPVGAGKNKCGTGSVTCTGSYSGTVSASYTTYAQWKSYSIKSRQADPLDNKNDVKYQSNKDNQHYAYTGTWVDGIFYADTAYYRGCSSPVSVGGPGKSLNPPDDPVVMGCWRQKKSGVSGLSLYGAEDYYEYKWSHVGYCGDKKCKQTTFDSEGKETTVTYNCGTKRCNTTLGPGNWELYKMDGEDGMTEELCLRKKDPICQPTTPKELDKSRNANYCNEKNLNIPLDEDTRCGADENNFYKIDCKESVKTDFEPISFEKVLVAGVDGGSYIDEKIATVQPGIGFRYNVKFNHVRSCEGNFQYEKFNTVFNNNVEIMRRADIYGDIQEYAWYYKILVAIDTISRTYEDQYTQIIEQGKYLFAYDGTISFNYKWGTGQNPETMTKTTDFIMNEEEEKVYLEDNNPIFRKTGNVRTMEEDPVFVNHKLVSGISDRKLHDFKYTLHQESLLEPKRVYIDRKTAKETNSESGIDGGKKLYTEEKTNVTEGENYKITSVVNVYKKSEPTKAIAVITNEKCELKVYKDNVIYRIIEPTNPFVNASRPIPKNWSGNIGDFTKAINPNIGTTIIK